MILDALIALMASSFTLVLDLIPSWTPPTEAFSQSSASVGSMASAGNGYFPVRVLGICLALVLGLKVALLAWRGVVFVYSVLPLKAT
ncbi:hypothetical protein [Sanguibacter sp. HDW7]|uniref:hypothetical protein n=1 Tax=Sanguibacter sp. HDW7 TaxID=2714931 RepID=UPI00140C6413|nr:hypothetical protein [Sanguibacter sp. HDW7]QIK83530.1 hypothetical protein G7063_07740 [Sanguibacter sp. HDW7]